jgi:hypothetical protein
MRRFHYQFTSGHQDFLVRECDLLALTNGGIGGREPNYTHRRRDHYFRFGMSGYTEQALAPPLNLRPGREAPGAQLLGQLVCTFGVGHRYQLRSVLLDLRGQLLDILARRKRHDAKTTRQRLNNTQTLPTN